MFILSQPSAFHTYVHSKLFIVVNLFAIIGSANCNRKGWAHDSEVLMGILDSVNAEFAHQLRIALWAEHLNLYKPEGRLVDGVAGAELWLNPTASAHAVQYNENANIEDKHTDIMWYVGQFWRSRRIMITFLHANLTYMRIFEASCFFRWSVLLLLQRLFSLEMMTHIHKEIRSQDVRDIIKDLSNQVQ